MTTVYLAFSLLLLQITIGASLALLTRSLAGGDWGARFIRALKRISQLTPAAAGLLAINLFFLKQTYIWVDHPELLVGRGQHVLMHPVGFAIRTLIVLAIFIWMGVKARDDKASRPMWSFALIVLFFAATVGSFDWIASVEPHWTSSILGILYLSGGFVGALALALLVAPDVETKPYMKGNLLFVGVCAWAYLVLSQLLVIYMGFEPDKLGYLARRAEGPYKPLTFAMWALDFLIPFLVLFHRPLKRRAAILVMLSIGVLLARWLEMADFVLPSTTPTATAVLAGSAAAVVGVAAMWRFAKS